MMFFKKIFLIPFFWILCLVAGAQNLSNIDYWQEKNDVVVSYDIDAFSSEVQLYVSTDGGKTYMGPLKKVEGDVKNVQPGSRTIKWHVLDEVEKLCGEQIVFQLRAGGQWVDLGLSVKWATCNLGATKPEEYGTYFAWGDVKGQTWNGSSWSGGGFEKSPAYKLDANNNLKPEYDAAHVILGGNWRMPTKAECQELIDNCTCTWTENYNGIGVSGRIFTSKKRGYTDKSIFLPAAGYGNFSYLSNVGSYGDFWSGTFYCGYYAWSLSFSSDDVYTINISRYIGQSIRPVMPNTYNDDGEKHTVSDTNSDNEDAETAEIVPFALVEQKPLFQGQDANTFSTWVNQHLEYPIIAKQNGIQGRVTMQFTVNTDGSVANVRVISAPDPELGNEAARVVKMSPKWTPGRQRDRVVKVVYTFPVYFQLK